MQKILITVVIFFALCSPALGKEVKIESPDKKIRVVISVDKELKYSVYFENRQYLDQSVIAMTLNSGTVLGKDPIIKKIKYKTINKVLKPLYGISAEIKEDYNEVSIAFQSNYSIVFRAYNEGMAYQFLTSFDKEITVRSERSDFRFSGNYTGYFHPQLSEADYRIQKISDYSIKPNYTSLPLLVKAEAGLNILIHESDVVSYPCLTLSVDSLNSSTLNASHAAYPTKVEPGGYMNFNLIVKSREDYIAKTKGNRSFPWRIIAFERNDEDILCNQLVYLLAGESKLQDVSWIRPGKVAWDWWNSLNLSGVPFRTGFNTETYKYYIDFAAANGIEFVNLDEGWSDQFDLLKISEKLNMEELLRYAKSKKVGLILWCVWHTLDRQMTTALDQFEKWGIAGLKVDFMDRDDQVVVEFQEKLLREAGARKMLVNYHGAYHPTGMSRTYPNNINVEGVKGLEWNKFDTAGTSPTHAVTVPFIRMFAGGMDYTPGAMNNFNRKDWKQVNDRPMSQGTRCHQLAMYVVYYAPMQMLADSPTAYEREPEFLKFLSRIPTVWDQTKPLKSVVGEYVAVARRKGSSWFVGVMTNWDARKLDIPLNFLDRGKTYEVEFFADGPNASRIGNDYITVKKEVRFGDVLPVELSKGGGFAARFSLK